MQARESYLSLLEKNMRANHAEYRKYATDAEAESANTLSEADILAAAVEEEYRIFGANKVITTYRRGMAFLMAEVKKETDAWRLHRSLRDFKRREPQEDEEEGSPRPQANSGFQGDNSIDIFYF